MVRVINGKTYLPTRVVSGSTSKRDNGEYKVPESSQDIPHQFRYAVGLIKVHMMYKYQGNPLYSLQREVKRMCRGMIITLSLEELLEKMYMTIMPVLVMVD